MGMTFTTISKIDKASSMKPDDLFVMSTRDENENRHKSNSVKLDTISKILETNLKEELDPRLKLFKATEHDSSGDYPMRNGEIWSCSPSDSIRLHIPEETGDMSREFAALFRNNTDFDRDLQFKPLDSESDTEYWGEDRYASDPIEANQLVLIWFNEIANHKFLVTRTKLSKLDIGGGWCYVTIKYQDMSGNQIQPDKTLDDPVRRNGEFTIPAGETIDGYQFKGWKDSAGHILTIGNSITLTESIDLYALYQRDTVYTIRFYTKNEDESDSQKVLIPSYKYVIRNGEIYLNDEGSKKDAMEFPWTGSWLPEGYIVEWEPSYIPSAIEISEDMDFIGTLKPADTIYTYLDEDGGDIRWTPVFLEVGDGGWDNELDLLAVKKRTYSGDTEPTPIYLDITSDKTTAS